MSDKKQCYFVKETKAGAKVLPIDPSSDDPFYRYKVHQLIVQVIGTGKMIRTAFLNGDEVAAELKIPADYVPHWIAYLVGAKAWYDPTKPERERASISGDYQLPDLSKHFEDFLNKFVLCQNCRLPEISYVPLKGNVGLKCRSCGSKGLASDLNVGEKFSRYVINHPPPKSMHLDKEKAARDKQLKQREKDDARVMKQAEELSVTGGDADGDGDGWAADASREAAAQRAAQLVSDKLRTMIITDGEGAGGARAAGDEAAAAADTTAGDDLRAFVTAHGDDACTSKDILGEINRLRAEYSLVDDDFPELLVSGLFGDLATATHVVKKRHPLLKRVLANNSKMQCGFLNECGRRHRQQRKTKGGQAFEKSAALFLKLLYDTDVFDEDTILAWASSEAAEPKPSPFSVAALPFTQWLANAEVEDDGDDDDDGGDAGGGGKAAGGKAAKGKAGDSADDDDAGGSDDDDN